MELTTSEIYDDNRTLSQNFIRRQRYAHLSHVDVVISADVVKLQLQAEHRLSKTVKLTF